MRHPIARGMLLLRTRESLSDMGFSRDERRAMIAAVDDEMIAAAEAQSGVTLPDQSMLAAAVGGPLDDRPILKMIVDFLKSPEGQALLKALLALILAAFAA